MNRLVILLLAVVTAVTAGCATPMKQVDPRSLTYPPLSFSIPKSERIVLENGMVVYLLEDHELPLVNMNAYIKTGGIYEPADKTGLASLTGEVLRSGGSLETPPEKLDADLEFMASAIESSIGAEAGNVALASLSRNLEPTLRYFAQLLMTPAFRADRVELARNNAMEGLRRQNDNPKAVADRELRKALYAGHPLGRVPTVETTKKISREDMIEFHGRYFHPNNIILAVAGDFRKDELLARLRRTFGEWKSVPVSFPAVGEPAPVKPEVLFVPKAINQSVIRMGELGIDKNNPDLYPLRVMDYILGGGFTSRLVTEIRSNQGLAYAVDSNLDVGRRFIGTFGAQTETKSETTGKAITLMKGIMAGMTEAPVTDQELQAAKDAIVNSFIFGFAKPEAVVNMQVRLEYFDYPAGYLEKYRDNISKVTKEDVLRVARTYVHPEKMILMVVGNEQKLDMPLGTFGSVRKVVLENGK